MPAFLQKYNFHAQYKIFWQFWRKTYGFEKLIISLFNKALSDAGMSTTAASTGQPRTLPASSPPTPPTTSPGRAASLIRQSVSTSPPPKKKTRVCFANKELY